MAKEPSRLKAIVGMKCPYCREGRFYRSHPYDLMHAGDTLDECPACRRSYTVEYGFYMGAMYLSYGLTVLNGILAYTLIRFVFGLEALVWQLVAVAFVVLVGAPLVYAYSKVLYGNIFLPYKGPSDPDYRPVHRPDRWK